MAVKFKTMREALIEVSRLKMEYLERRDKKLPVEETMKKIFEIEDWIDANGGYKR